jgi:hypothetical protein
LPSGKALNEILRKKIASPAQKLSTGVDKSGFLETTNRYRQDPQNYKQRGVFRLKFFSLK